MKILQCYQDNPCVLTTRLFDSRVKAPKDFVDLTKYIAMRFDVVETIGGVDIVILRKKYEDISVSLEYEYLPPNIVNIAIGAEDLHGVKPNPPNRDRWRFWILWGQTNASTWEVIDRGYFYLDSMTAV